MSTIKYAYQRFSTERFPLPSEDQLVELERRIGVRFPEDYREFVLEFNGGCFDDPEITPVGDDCPLESLATLFGIAASFEAGELGRVADISLFDDNDPPRIVPIGSTPMGGLIILDTAPGDGQGAIFLKQAFGDFHYLVDGHRGVFRPAPRRLHAITGRITALVIVGKLRLGRSRPRLRHGRHHCHGQRRSADRRRRRPPGLCIPPGRTRGSGFSGNSFESSWETRRSSHCEPSTCAFECTG